MRKEPSLKLERSPLVFVLSQVRFPAILKMRDHVPDIQEALRQTGFPRYSKEDIQQVTFAFGEPEIKAERDTRWVFANRNRTEAVVLATSFVMYETSDYDVFETFTDRFSAALDPIIASVEIDFAEQLGLRYVDLIRPTNDKNASDFLSERVRGLSLQDLGATRSRHQFTTQAETEHGNLHVRSFENTGPNFMPPDLVSTHLEFNVDPVEFDAHKPFRVLDIDHITKVECDFTASIIIDKLWGLHKYSSKAFRAAVTKEAIKCWKEKIC